jgi:Protein of unknown function (DUF2752)
VQAACSGHVHRAGPDARAPVAVDLRPLRAAGAAMLAVALVLPTLALPNVVLCPLRRLTGVPCPFCGMTRSVTALVHGDLGASLALNPGGILVVALAAVLLVLWRVRRVTIPVWPLALFFGSLWAYQLFKYSTGRAL